MKNLRFVFLLSMVLFMTSCSVKIFSPRPSGHVPPGQAKKMTGAKSARAYAPGQQKH